MAIVSAICTSYKQELFSGVHSSTDTYKIALFLSTATLGATTTAYSSANETSGPGYVAGGQDLAGFTTGSDAGVAWITFDDAVWMNSTITARGALIYNSSKADRALAVLNFGGDVATSNGALIVKMPVADKDNALIRYA